MKEFIEAGIKGGVDVADSLKKLGYKNVDEFPYNHFDINADDGVEQVDFCFEKKLNYYQVTTVSFQALIFSTNIVECAIKDRTCLKCGLKFVKESITMGKRFINCMVNEEWRNDYTPCDRYKLSHDADYHRSIMANIKDIEKLKEYCRGLVK